MPPQSRGPSPEIGSRPYSKSDALPPTLRPYLENLPSPTTLIPEQRTPTGPHLVIPDRDGATPTPTPRTGRIRAATAFELGGDDRDGTEDEDGARPTDLSESEYDVSGVTLDDDDFESHYSRHESSESEEEDGAGLMGEIGDGEAEEELDDDERRHASGAASPGGYFPSSSDRPDSLARVRSLPARPAVSRSQGPSPHGAPSGGLHTSQSTTSLPPAAVPAPLYPPFYNRPPTPLPPSPSLTSLLRPPSLLNRSATSTRPTTPDSSDVETPNDTEAAVAHSARRAHPLPPTAPKVPTYEYYGFVLYLASSLAFLMYLLWSYLPSPFLHAFGITYYPNRWWSLAFPSWIVVLLVFIYVALLSYNVEYLTIPLTSLECMVDEAGNVAIVDHTGRLRKGGSKAYMQEAEQRIMFERERESKNAKNKTGPGRRASRAGSGAGKDRPNSKEKEKAGRRPPRIDRDDFYALPSAVASFPSHHSMPPDHTGRPPGPASPAPLSAFPLQADVNGLVSRLSFQQGGSQGNDPNWKLVWSEGTDGVMDIPIGGVCEVLYN